jgi:exonuclease III
VPLKPFWLKEEKEPNWGKTCVRQARGMSPSPGRRAKHRPEGEEVVGSASSPAKQDLAELAMPSGRPQSGTTAGDLTNIGTFADGDEAVRSVAGQPRCLEHLRRSRRPPREDPNISVRNTARGLRSRAAIAVRRNRRNDKRKCARKGSRARRGGPAQATAQEPSTGVSVLRLKGFVYMATLNVRGLVAAHKCTEVEDWMSLNKIDILLLQETHVGGVEQVKRARYTWYHSGGSESRTIYAGVAIVIRNAFRNYVSDIQTHSERLMHITLRGIVPLHYINAYMPTAAAATETKKECYDALKILTQKLRRRGFVCAAGDMNARVQVRISEAEDMVGDHTFDKGNTYADSLEPRVEESRSMLLEYAEETHQKLMNTFFPKQDKYLFTYCHDKRSPGGAPYDRTRYETLSYVFVPDRWKNAIKISRTTRWQTYLVITTR